LHWQVAPTNIVFASDDFESGSNGWDTATSTSGNFNTGEMLGQLGGSNDWYVKRHLMRLAPTLCPINSNARFNAIRAMHYFTNLLTADFNGLVELNLAVTTIESSNNATNTSNQAINIYFEPVNELLSTLSTGASLLPVIVMVAVEVDVSPEVSDIT
jgi:hypothetical protein